MFWYPKQEDYDAKDSQGVTLRDFLCAYRPGDYERPAVTVDNLILRKTNDGYSLLMIRRGRHPYYNMLALPGGFIEMTESLEDAAARELMEETGITGLKCTQLGAYGTVGRDPRLRIISVAYLCVIAKEIECKAGDDASDAGFYTVKASKKMNNLETIYELRLINGNDTAGAIIAETEGKRRITDSLIASDHAIMILDALERLGSIENM